MGWIKGILFLAIALGVLMLLAGRFGMLAGRTPNDLGVIDGRLKPPSKTRNSVSSQAALYPDHPQKDYALVKPFAVQDDGAAALKRLSQLLQSVPGVKVVTADDTYVYAQCQTQWLRFTDDLELWWDADAKVIQVRSASRLGREDFGVNRQRVEWLRQAFEAK
jgi:uncharacterized protein (DUF1499 family)